MIVVLCDNCNCIARKVPSGVIGVSNDLTIYTHVGHNIARPLGIDTMYHYCSVECQQAHQISVITNFSNLYHCVEYQCVLLDGHKVGHRKWQAHEWL